MVSNTPNLKYQTTLNSITNIIEGTHVIIE